MGLVGLETCAGEGQQQFSIQAVYFHANIKYSYKPSEHSNASTRFKQYDFERWYIFLRLKI
jgi:hypothetical protein